MTLKQARKLFQDTAPTQAQCEANASPFNERTRYWNWFRIGIRAAKTGKVSASDKRWVNSTPASRIKSQ